MGVAYEDSYLKVLEKNLNASNDLADISMMSAGVAGSDPLFGYMLLRDKLLRFEPDLITLAINDSDVTDVIRRGGKERFLDDGSLRAAKPPADEWLYELSHFYRFIKMALLGYDWLHLRRSERERKIADAVDHLALTIADARDLGVKEGFELVVVLHPMRHELTNGDYGRGLRELRDHLKEHQVSFVDLLPFYADSLASDDETPSSLYWERDGHHNAPGYALFAEGLEDYLRAQGIVTAR
ncbi:MAG: hypothetical protein AAF637_09030 [Pseudomonadota bacterium]